MGVTNWIFKLVNKILGTNKFGELEDWCRHRGITIHNYQGGGLDGNNSKKFLKKCNDLDQLLPDTAAPTTAAIIDVLNKFDKVVSGCFGYNLVADYSQLLDKFKTSIWELFRVYKCILGITHTVS